MKRTGSRRESRSYLGIPALLCRNKLLGAEQSEIVRIENWCLNLDCKIVVTGVAHGTSRKGIACVSE